MSDHLLLHLYRPVDDVLNVSGHRIGTAEVESALVLHDDVAQAAVVGKPHEIKGQAIAAFVMLNEGKEESPELLKELNQYVCRELVSSNYAFLARSFDTFLFWPYHAMASSNNRESLRHQILSSWLRACP